MWDKSEYLGGQYNDIAIVIVIGNNNGSQSDIMVSGRKPIAWRLYKT